MISCLEYDSQKNMYEKLMAYVDALSSKWNKAVSKSMNGGREVSAAAERREGEAEHFFSAAPLSSFI